MKKLGTILFLALGVFLQSQAIAQTTREVLSTRPVHPSYSNVFNEAPKMIDAFKGTFSPQSKSETLQNFDASVTTGSTFNLIIGAGPEVDQNGAPLQSPDGTNYYFDEYATRFTSQLPKPRLDSIRIWFIVDSMVNVTNNGFAISVIKMREDTLTTTGQIVPVPNLGVTATKTVFIPRTSVAAHIGDSVRMSMNIPMNSLLVPQNFMVSISGLVAVDSKTPPTLVKNLIQLVSDSVDMVGTWDDTAPYDTTVLRTYFVTLNESATYYQTFFRIFDLRQSNLGIYSPNIYMIAYLHDPNAAVNDVPLTGNVLAQNFPNPFNPSTEIRYSIADHGNVTLKVYNALGIEMKTLVDGVQDAGEHNVNFYGDDMPSGTYYYTLKTGTFSETKRMVLTK